MTQVGQDNPSSTAGEPEVPAEFPSPVARGNRKSSILSLVATAVIVPGLFATVALPAYAFSPPTDASIADASRAKQQLISSQAQTIVVAASASGDTVVRDAFTTTTASALTAASLPAYSGPSVADLLANPPYPNFSLDQVAQVALQYQGVPYVFGGASPSGFDCSGLVMFVYAQFGISLPHSVAAQAALGTPIAREAALPGDIVTMDGHNGIYLGNGTFIDAPYEGKPVLVRPIYTDDYYIYRLGI